jgi:hypothetical protein
MRNAHGHVDIQSVCGHIQNAVDRDRQRDGPHLRRNPRLDPQVLGIAPDGGSLVGIYLWESVAAANAFHTPDWVAMVTKRWAGIPQRQEWETSKVANERSKMRESRRNRRLSTPFGAPSPYGFDADIADKHPSAAS